MSIEWKQKIHSAYTGASLYLRPAGAMYMVQDALTALHAKNKCGNMELGRDYNSFWVITKSKVQFMRYPAWHESVLVSATTADAGKVRTELQVELRDEKGEVCVQARQELCVLDFAHHRPRRLADVGFTPESEALPKVCYERFSADPLPCHYTQTVLPHMIDMSGHLNNVEYIKLALDCFDTDFTARYEPAELEAHHLRECKEGALLTICEKTQGDTSLVRILCEDSPAFEMKIIWREKE